MVKLNVLDKTGKKISDFNLNLSEDIREDIFKKAVISEGSLFRQSKGSDPEAGKKQVINVSKRRRKFRTTYGRGGSRTPKKSMWARGTQHRFVGAFASNTVGGRRPHAPKAWKNIFKDINNKEWLKALRVGVAASLDNGVVSLNGQKIPSTYPFLIDSEVEKIEKTKDFLDVLKKLGFEEEIKRTSERKIKAGKATMRNRTYKVKRGPLVVVSSYEAPLMKAARNILGFEVISFDLLMASDFGMSEKPGRAVIFTQKAMEEFSEVLNN